MDQSLYSRSEIFDKLSDLSNRISRIESHLSLSELRYDSVQVSEINHKKTEDEKESLEFEIGQLWFAKAGIAVLALGIAIVLMLPFGKLPSYMPSLLGYIVAIVLFGFSRMLNISLNLISRYLFGSAFLLLFFSTLRLHYWGNPSFITTNLLEFILLLVISIMLLTISVRNKSTYLYNIALTLGSIAALVSGETYIIFLSILAIISLSSYIKIKYEWGRLFYYSIALSYITHFIWFINNPLIAGNKIQLVDEPYLNIFFLMMYLIVISIGNIFRKFEFGNNKEKVISSFFNSFGFLILFTLITITQFRSEITISFIAASILFLLLSILLWKKDQDKYSVFFFSIIGYISLSIAILNAFEIPEVFIWLCWQSILVVSTAIWFRSKIIIVANFLIYLSLVIGTVTSSVYGGHSLSCMNIGIVSLLSARILNSQKGKLELKTEAMRNAYLAIAFFLLPYSTYLLVPVEYVGFTWLAIGLLYYAFSLLLKNNKYRWMAMMTLAITIVFTLIFGISNPDNELQIISFLVVGIVLIIISIVYTKMGIKNKVGIKKDLY